MATQKNRTENQKKCICKNYVISELRKSWKKHGKNATKSIVNVNKGGTFAPATSKCVH